MYCDSEKLRGGEFRPIEIEPNQDHGSIAALEESSHSKRVHRNRAELKMISSYDDS